MIRRSFIIFLSLLLGVLLFTSEGIAQSPGDPDQSNSMWGKVQSTIEKYLHRPYVWGAVGLKSFDCSGFVWRVMNENGITIKRTTARKFFVSLPKAQDNSYYEAGLLVFFNNMKHIGIVRDHGSFYHAQVSLGTNLSWFDPYWRCKICGFRRIPTQS